MKTYIFDTFNRYKRFSEELDAKTVLCNKSWYVLNDSGEKEVYIFNTDGTLIISVSGRVTNATWKYIPVNKSIIISGNNQSYMVHPAFYDNMIFALQMDGANEYAFLIDEQKISSTNLRTFNDLVIYFAEKERQAILAEERKRQATIETERQKQIELERQKQQKIEDSEEGIYVDDILLFLCKCGFIFCAWYGVPLLYSLFFDLSFPHAMSICLSIETILAIVLFKLWKKERLYFLLCLVVIFVSLLIANYQSYH